MKYLKQEGYITINLKQFQDLIVGKIKNDKKYILITFDDGYMDNYTKAYPILKSYGFVATVFVITDWMNGTTYMGWEQAKKLQSNGWDIMSHTKTHPHLPMHKHNNQLKEIKESKKEIEKHLNNKVNVFAYPYGQRNSSTVKILEENEYDIAFTFDYGLTTSDQDPYLYKRIFVSGTENLSDFKTQLIVKDNTVKAEL